METVNLVTMGSVVKHTDRVTQVSYKGWVVYHACFKHPRLTGRVEHKCFGRVLRPLDHAFRDL